MSDMIVLSVGEDYRVTGLLQGSITYAGMPYESVYSIVHKKEIGGHYAYNLFFPKYTREFAIAGIIFSVERVTPQAISLQIEQKVLALRNHEVPAEAHA